jgi:hypothetical protein
MGCAGHQVEGISSLKQKRQESEAPDVFPEQIFKNIESLLRPRIDPAWLLIW